MTSRKPTQSRRLATDIGIRILGVAIVGTGSGAGYGLTHWGLRGPFPFLLATIAFIGLSFGGLLAALGHHIFDQVEVSPRWRSSSSTTRS